MRKLIRPIIGAAFGVAMFVTLLPPPVVQGASRPAEAPPGAKAGDPVKGQKIFTVQKCTTCHGVNDKAKKLGPDLGAIGSRRDAAWLAKFLVNPTPLDPAKPPIVKMVPVNVKGRDLDDLIAYLLTLKNAKIYRPINAQ